MRKLTKNQEFILEFAKRHVSFHIRELHMLLYFRNGEKFSSLQKKIGRLKKRGNLKMIKPGLYSYCDNQK